MEVFKLFATLGLNASEFDKGLSLAERRLKGVESNFTSAGRTLTAGVTAPIVGVGAAAIASSISFESAFAGVRKTVDATEAEFAELEAGIRNMASRLPASAEQIAQVAEAAGQLGIKTENILEFTEVMIGLGESTNLTADQAATALARFANITQMPQENFDRLGSVIVDLGNNLATTEAEITEMGLRLAGAGNIIGLSEAEILGVAGALSSVGIAAEAGGTAMSRTMKTMMVAVMEGGDDLEKFAAIAGVSADEFATAFQERPTEAIAMFTNGLGRINTEGGNVVEALKGVGLSDIRVSDALLRMAGAGDVLTESVQIATQAWGENTALQVEVGRRYETTESQLSVLKNQMIEVVRTLGDALVPLFMSLLDAAKPLIAALQSLAEWFGSLDPRMQTIIVTITGLVAALGPILWLVGSFAGAVSNLLPILRLVPGAFTAIRTAIGLLSGPVGWIITAITLIAAAWATDFLGMRTFLIEQWGHVRQSFVDSWEALKDLGGRIAGVVTSMWSGVTTAFATARDRISGLFDGIRQHFQLFVDFVGAIFRGDFRAALDAAQAIVENWWTTINDFFSGIPAKMLEIGKNIMMGLVDGVKSMMTAAVDAVKGVGNKIVDGFKGLLGIESPSKVFHELGLEIGQGLVGGIDASVPAAEAAAKRLGSAVAAAGRVAMSGALSADNIVGGIIGGLEGKDAIEALQDRLAQLKTQRDSLITAGSTARRVGGAFIDAQTKALETELRRLREELVQSRAINAREGEIQTRRFSMAVTTFGNDVRGLTLARQRY